MELVERALGKVVVANNERMARRAFDAGDPNPRDLTGCEWNRCLEAAWPTVRAEWDAFAAESRLPLIEQLIDEHQGNTGEWRAGLLVAKGKAVGIAPRFPRTLEVLGEVPGLWSALFSVLSPGAALETHAGPNRGVLRYHLGVVCPEGAALEVEGTVVPYREGSGILFDDTQPHAAWNRSDSSRVTLFVELRRPAPRATDLANAAVQRLIALDPRYRLAPRRAAAWDLEHAG